MIDKAFTYLIGGLIALVLLPVIATQFLAVVVPLAARGLAILFALLAVGAAVWFVIAVVRHRLGVRRHRGSWGARDPWHF